VRKSREFPAYVRKDPRQGGWEGGREQGKLGGQKSPGVSGNISQKRVGGTCLGKMDEKGKRFVVKTRNHGTTRVSRLPRI